MATADKTTKLTQKSTNARVVEKQDQIKDTIEMRSRARRDKIQGLRLGEASRSVVRLNVSRSILPLDPNKTSTAEAAVDEAEAGAAGDCPPVDSCQAGLWLREVRVMASLAWTHSGLGSTGISIIGSGEAVAASKSFANSETDEGSWDSSRTGGGTAGLGVSPVSCSHRRFLAEGRWTCTATSPVLQWAGGMGSTCGAGGASVALATGADEDGSANGADGSDKRAGGSTDRTGGAGQAATLSSANSGTVGRSS